MEELGEARLSLATPFEIPNNYVCQFYVEPSTYRIPTLALLGRGRNDKQSISGAGSRHLIL